MLQWYVRYHTLACVVPAMPHRRRDRHLLLEGGRAAAPGAQGVNKAEAYGGLRLRHRAGRRSCSVLPMFAGIYRAAAWTRLGLPGPVINVMAIFLTARVLGFDRGMPESSASITFAGSGW